MNDYVAKITLDLNCQAIPTVISAGQYDIGRQIKISLTADGEAYDATGATAVCKGKSGSNYFAVNATVAKNIVTVTTDKAMLSSAGRTIAKIVLADGTHTYSTQPFVINTHSDYDGDITTSDYYPELLDILSRVLALTESGAVLTDTELSASSVNPLQNKALTPIINTINNRLQSAEQNLYSKANATDVSNALKSKEDNLNKVSSKTDITDSSTNYPSIKYLGEYYYDANETYSSEETDKFLGNKANVNSVYSKTESDKLLGNKADKADVDTSLANKANLVNSLNIFDFDEWANNLQKSSKPIVHGTLDELNFDEKSITFTATEKDTYTNSWQVFLTGTTKISVKPNTKYWVYYTVNNYVCYLVVFLNGNHTDGALVSIKNGKGTFVTNNDTSFITIRVGTYNSRGAFKVSKIMITEKESIYLPNKVAEGVTEVANEVLTFEKTTQTSLANKYDSSNIESGTSTLTPHSNVTDKIKNASCTYKTIGDVVIVSATVKMNAVSLGSNSMCPLIDLPYKCISEDNVFCVGISNLGKLFKFAIPKNNTWLQFSTQDKTAYTFADGEQINVICSYKIK